eukprot:2721-Eustigmatos_ZCMA.PRE.1
MGTQRALCVHWELSGLQGWRHSHRRAHVSVDRVLGCSEDQPVQLSTLSVFSVAPTWGGCSLCCHGDMRGSMGPEAKPL